jgi:hypothetical protein
MPIGNCWAPGSWVDDAWAPGSWRDYGDITPGRIVCLAGRDRSNPRVAGVDNAAASLAGRDRSNPTLVADLDC